MKLYHITKKENAESILTEGIIPGKEKGLTSQGPRKKTFLTNDIRRVKDTMMTKNLIKESVVFEVDTKYYKIDPHIYEWNNKTSDFEFTCSEIIKPEHLRKINNI